MRDSEFLQWIHDRLLNVHHENEYYDYMHRLRRIISDHKRLENKHIPPMTYQEIMENGS